MRILYVAKHNSGDNDVTTLPRKAPAHLRFVRDTDKNGKLYKNLGRCWIWKRGPLSKNCPYGQISVKHKSIRVHRYSWMIHRGEIPAGMSVLHKCDNPLCVNPRHLFLGTQLDNQRDMVSKNRQAKGRAIWASKLTPSQVRQIRRRYKVFSRGHGNGGQLAREFGVTKTAIQYIASGRNWRHL